MLARKASIHSSQASPWAGYPSQHEETTLINITTLMGYRARAARRRLSGGLALAGVGFALVAGIALAGGAVQLGLHDNANQAFTNEVLRERVFWFATLPLLVICYLSFDMLYRARDARLLNTLPLSSGPRMIELTARSTVIMTPLIMPGLSYALALDTGPAQTYALLVPSLTLILAVPLSLLVHMAAGVSATRGGGRLKQYLAQGMVVDDAALLLYAPAGALFVNLSIGIFSELFLKEALLGTRPGLFWYPVIWSLGLAGIATLQAAKLSARHLNAAFAMFQEADIPPPYREDGLPESTPGAGFSRLLPTHSRPYFLRDLRQLRRRHRLDRILLFLYVLVLLRLNLAGDTSTVGLWTNLIALTAFVGILLPSAFRLAGAELGAPSLTAALPTSGRASTWGRLGACTIYPAWAWFWTILGAILTLTPAHVLTLAISGAGLVLGLMTLSQWIAHRAKVSNMTLCATSWRLGLIAMLGTTLGLT